MYSMVFWTWFFAGLDVYAEFVFGGLVDQADKSTGFGCLVFYNLMDSAEMSIVHRLVFWWTLWTCPLAAELLLAAEFWWFGAESRRCWNTPGGPGLGLDGQPANPARAGPLFLHLFTCVPSAPLLWPPWPAPGAAGPLHPSLPCWHAPVALGGCSLGGAVIIRPCCISWIERRRRQRGQTRRVCKSVSCQLIISISLTWS